MFASFFKKKPSLLLAAALTAAAGPEGRWLTHDRDGVIEITPCDAGICGRIVGMAETRRTDGGLPAGPFGQPICGRTILHAAPDGPDRWSGLITDPENDTDWHCIVRLAEDGTLRVRGYILFPLLGQAQIWMRYAGPVAADCSLPG